MIANLKKKNDGGYLLLFLSSHGSKVSNMSLSVFIHVIISAASGRYSGTKVGLCLGALYAYHAIVSLNMFF